MQNDTDSSKKFFYKNSNVNVLEFLISILTIQNKHHANEGATKDILKLFSLVLQTPNKCPRSLQPIQSQLVNYNVDSRHHKYCTNCKAADYCSNLNKCYKCNVNLIEFQTLDFLSQIKLILKN